MACPHGQRLSRCRECGNGRWRTKRKEDDYHVITLEATAVEEYESMEEPGFEVQQGYRTQDRGHSVWIVANHSGLADSQTALSLVDTYVPGPPLYVPEAQGSLTARHLHRTRAAHTANRGTAGTPRHHAAAARARAGPAGGRAAAHPAQRREAGAQPLPYAEAEADCVSGAVQSDGRSRWHCRSCLVWQRAHVVASERLPVVRGVKVRHVSAGRWRPDQPGLQRPGGCRLHMPPGLLP